MKFIICLETYKICLFFNKYLQKRLIIKQYIYTLVCVFKITLLYTAIGFEKMKKKIIYYRCIYSNDFDDIQKTFDDTDSMFL